MSNLFITSKKQTLHILGTGPQTDPDRGHLHIILTNKCPDENHLLVSISTRHHGCDDTCLLRIGDHDFIKKDSYVAYRHTKIWSANKISQKITNGDITFRGLIDEKIFALISLGIENSMFIKPKIKKYYRQNKLN